MRFCFLLSLLLLWASQSMTAQTQVQAQLAHWLKQAYGFDHEFPREKVLLYFNRPAYVEGDTLWYKAFVLRASTHRPDTLSRVLYVELLNDQGQIMDRSRLRIDSYGQAQGHFDLGLPKRTGFYEVRAYTRAMTNWGERAVYSRVIPLFERNAASSLNINRPEGEQDLMPGHERPYQWGREGERSVAFYPEGGARVAQLPQRVVYRITDGRGAAIDDSLQLFTAEGQLLLSSRSEHQGLGSFQLQEGSPAAYVEVGGQRFDLPAAKAEGCVLTLEHEGGSYWLNVQTPHQADVTLGAVIFAHERPLWFNAFPVNREGTLVEIPDTVLRMGVHRIEVYDAQGRSWAHRLFFHHAAPSAQPQVRLRQSAASYEAFAPIALDIEVLDAQGRGLPTQLCLNVADAEATLIADPLPSLQAQLLLSSELRGYIPHPESYFQPPHTPARQRALDLLMQAQGWRATPFEQMCGSQAFPHPQPLEDRLIVRGQLLRDNDRQQGLPQMQLKLSMYSTQEGAAATGETQTDHQGRFAFASNLDYVGPWMATFFSHEAQKGKKRWTRLTLDQWFNPRPRAFDPLELTLYEPPATTLTRPELAQNELFSWPDTIPDNRKYYLRAAEVKAKGAKRYKGLNFNRYTYAGGEKVGLKRASIYFNVPLELDRAKDQGLAFHSYTEFLAHLLSDFSERQAIEEAELKSKDLSERNRSEEQRRAAAERGQRPDDADPRSSLDYLRSREDRAGVKNDAQLSYLTYRGQPVHVVINNGAGVAGGDYINIAPEEIKSAMLSLNGGYHLHGATSESLADHVLFLYTHPDWSKFRERKGENRRLLHGFERPLAFPAPNYREADQPRADDYRPTLYWQPSLRTDHQGRATAIFFNNARAQQQPRISLRGITSRGELIVFDR